MAVAVAKKAGSGRPPSGNAAVKPAEDLGPRPVLEWLPLERLVVDARYQRQITSDGIKIVNRIVREFSWSKFQPLTVSGPDASGDYPVIDGQHRLEACRRHPAVDEAPCWVVKADLIADQAANFVAINKNRIAVTRVASFWAALAAHDRDALWVKSVCDRAGVSIGRVGTGVQPPKTTVALAAIQKMRVVGEASFVRTLGLLATAQPDQANAFRGSTIVALTKMVGLSPELDDARAIAALAELDLDDLIEKATAFRKAWGGTTENALHGLFARAYNKGLRETSRIPEPKGV